MTMDMMGAGWLIPFAFAIQGVSAVLILIRLVRGPTGPDRVVAIDALTLLGAAALALLALHTGQKVLLDAAVVLALVSFIGTTAFVLLFATREADDDAGESPRRLSGLSDRSEPSGRTRTDSAAFEAHSHSMQRESGRIWTVSPSGAVDQPQVRQPPREP